MIRSFSCKNFYSFADENIVSLLVNDKAPISDMYADSLSGERISKALVIIGPNASGKTNLIKVLPFLKWFILDSFKLKLDAEIPVKPFIFNNTKSNPTEISIEFEIEKEIYEYFVSITNKRIIAEELKVKTKGKQRLTSKTLFTRNWNSKMEKYEFTGKNFKLPNDFKNSLRNNASIISIANQFNHIGSKTITNYWSKIRTNVVETGLPENLFPFLSSFNFFNALEFYSENKILKEKAEKILARFDLGITSFDVKKEKKERGTSLDATVFHSINGGSFEIPIIYESSGTKQLVTLLKSILQVLEDGSTAILDELDAYLHPDMVEALFELFISPDTNTKNAQIIFSTHSHRILNQMDKYQIILTEKNDKGSSEAWRLDDVEGVRADDNYYAKYVAGAYGAVPNID
ncbi:MAG: Abortive infection protein [Candidatus Moranbacteria bacterium GW2011_GWF2_34_56]|nr:MAG: Abortive infection protein [Candidatus Moranbacteria bacterium GW2011_GWF1_34_10]KKP64451.1 MAG: Abortive infection protein [Candidatus Moranbacteria bacterium GW2011_GWF2_34_56]HBI17099.1 hypothetical protein [Candidatus Moranbacteria bacterium]